MEWIWRGRAWVFGDDVPTDGGVMPLHMVRLQEYRPSELKKYCFEEVRPEFAGKAKPHDLVVAGKNFGYGNPHIQGYLGLYGLSVGVLAESMPRGPMRACVNGGVPLLIVPDISKFARDGDELVVDWLAGVLKNETTGQELRGDPMPQIMRELIECGGGIEWMKKRLGISAAPQAVS